MKDFFKLKIINLNNICLFLVVLIPPTLVTGPFIPDLFLTIASIIFLYICFKENKFYYFDSYFFKFFFIFYLYLIFNSLFSESFAHSFKISLFYIRFGIFCILINYLINEKKIFINLFFNTLLFTILFITFDAYIQFFLGKNLIGLVPLDYPRISGMFGEELILGSYISRMLPLIVGLLFLKKINIYKILLFLIFVEILILITGERTALGIIVLTTLLFILFLKELKILRLTSSFVVLILSFFILTQFSETKKRIFDHTLMEFGLSSDKQIQKNFEGVEPIYKDFYLFSPKHQSMIMTSYRMWKDKFLIGHGIRSYKYKCKDPKYQFNSWSCASHPHHIISQILSEIGLIGLVFYLIIIGYLLYVFYLRIFFKSVGKTNFENYKICLIISILITIWPLFPSGNIFNNWLSIIFYLPVGFYLNSINYSKNKSYD